MKNLSKMCIRDRGKSADDYVKEYYGYLENKEYGKMYNMLTKGSLAKTSQKVFEARYKNIYEGIEAKNIEIKIGEVEDGDVYKRQPQELKSLNSQW